MYLYRNCDIDPFMNENENKYLSLKTAAGLYGYTRDHLGLMIRQNKLRGIKLGSYYVTTNEWMADYLKKYSNPNHPAIRGKFSNKFLTQAFTAEENSASYNNAKKPKNSPTGNLPKGDKIPQTSIKNKSEDNFFRDIQKELLSSLLELSTTREENGIFDNPYVILPIREMKESERKEIINKISEHSESKSRQETA